MTAGQGYDGWVSGKVLLAWPRGYCAGVDRAVETVERLLEAQGPPVYVRKQIVHNLHVVRDLEAKRFAREGRTILLIGHEGHEEVVGTSGEAPEHVILVGSPAEAETVEVDDQSNLAYLTQTTLSVDETNEIIDILRRRFPEIQGPPKEDICYATQNRQDAVKELARRSDVVLVIGSANSSNSKRLAEVAREMGTPAHLVDDEHEVDASWLDGASTVGVTSGASAPEWLVDRMIEFLRARGYDDLEELRVREEQMHFSMPAGIRRLEVTSP